MVSMSRKAGRASLGATESSRGAGCGDGIAEDGRGAPRDASEERGVRAALFRGDSRLAPVARLGGRVASPHAQEVVSSVHRGAEDDVVVVEEARGGVDVRLVQVRYVGAHDDGFRTDPPSAPPLARARSRASRMRSPRSRLSHCATARMDTFPDDSSQPWMPSASDASEKKSVRLDTSSAAQRAERALRHALVKRSRGVAPDARRQPSLHLTGNR